MPASFLCTCSIHACCAVRGALVVMGGQVLAVEYFTMPPPREWRFFPKGAGAFVELPPLSCGANCGAIAISVNNSHSALEQMLLLRGHDQQHTATSSVRLVDLATGRMHTAG
jgi:hypothetical protein